MERGQQGLNGFVMVAVNLQVQLTTIDIVYKLCDRYHSVCVVYMSYLILWRLIVRHHCQTGRIL